MKVFGKFIPLPMLVIGIITGIFLVVFVMWGVKTWNDHQQAEAFRQMFDVTPTYTWDPDGPPLPTPTPVTPTPTAEGWTTQQRYLGSPEVLVPPPDVRAELRQKFEIRRDVGILVEPWPRDEAWVEAKVAELGNRITDEVLQGIVKGNPEDYGLVPPVIDHRTKEEADGDLYFLRVVEALGARIDIQCSDYEHCTVSQSLLNYRGAEVLSDWWCQMWSEEGGIPDEVDPTAPCFTAGNDVIRNNTDDPEASRFGILTVDFERQEDGRWLLTQWQIIRIPPPPDWEGETD